MKRTPSGSEPLWRDEFAIQTGVERYVARRQFSKFLVLTSLGMFIGNLWILVRSWFAEKPSFMPQQIAAASDIGVGEVKLFSYPTREDPCIMIRTAADSFVAYSQKCTHLSCAVYFAKDHNRLECPCHEGYFSVETGSVLQGPPPRPLPRITLKRDGDNLIATGIEL
ncbi:MAG TPA: ubiquinol-cytochrome c reductase iron-sulfur subunit [Terriglobia bacterium]|nr:ubiquinol-cytochrome c reductase iron-sulfur subunit [Terriglobia bacterium]